MTSFFSFVSGFQNVIYCYVRQLEMPKNTFQKSDLITFTHLHTSPLAMHLYYKIPLRYEGVREMHYHHCEFEEHSAISVWSTRIAQEES